MSELEFWVEFWVLREQKDLKKGLQLEWSPEWIRVKKQSQHLVVYAFSQKKIRQLWSPKATQELNSELKLRCWSCIVLTREPASFKKFPPLASMVNNRSSTHTSLHTFLLNLSSAYVPGWEYWWDEHVAEDAQMDPKQITDTLAKNEKGKITKILRIGQIWI